MWFGCGKLPVALVQQAVLVGDGFLDAGGLFGAGELADQLEGEGDGAAQAVAGGDVAVDDDLLVQHLGAGQLVLEGGVGGGLAVLGAAQMAATLRSSAASALTAPVTAALAARLGVPGMPPGSTTRSTAL